MDPYKEIPQDICLSAARANEEIVFQFNVDAYDAPRVISLGVTNDVSQMEFRTLVIKVSDSPLSAVCYI